MSAKILWTCSEVGACLVPEVTVSAFQKELRKSVEEVGIPSLEGATSPKEEVVELLKLAAEVEHALMIQYLYTASSLRSRDKKLITKIAIEEMGHLVSVQNLIIALTGVSEEGIPTSIHLGRDGLRASSERNPLDFTLEEASRLGIAKFALVERPEEIHDGELRTHIDALRQELETVGFDARPVSTLYAAIRWIFQPSDESVGQIPLSVGDGFKPGWHLSPEDFQPRELIERHSSNTEEWAAYPGLIIAVATNHQESLELIDGIMAQGEGPIGRGDSHFEKFMDLLSRFENDRVRVRPRLPRTPYVDGQPVPSDPLSNEITNPYTLLWAKLFNLTYETMITDIAWGISQPRDDEKREVIIGTSMRVMREVLSPLSKYISSLRMNILDELNAGPTYGLKREDVPTTIAGFKQRYSDLSAQEKALISAIRSTPEFAGDTRASLRIHALENIQLVRPQYTPGETS